MVPSKLPLRSIQSNIQKQGTIINSVSQGIHVHRWFSPFRQRGASPNTTDQREVETESTLTYMTCTLQCLGRLVTLCASLRCEPVWPRLDSAFLSFLFKNVMVFGHCLVTLSLTIFHGPVLYNMCRYRSMCTLVWGLRSAWPRANSRPYSVQALVYDILPSLEEGAESGARSVIVANATTPTPHPPHYTRVDQPHDPAPRVTEGFVSRQCTHWVDDVRVAADPRR